MAWKGFPSSPIWLYRPNSRKRGLYIRCLWFEYEKGEIIKWQSVRFV